MQNFSLFTYIFEAKEFLAFLSGNLLRYCSKFIHGLFHVFGVFLFKFCKTLLCIPRYLFSFFFQAKSDMSYVPSPINFLIAFWHV